MIKASEREVKAFAQQGARKAVQKKGQGEALGNIRANDFRLSGGLFNLISAVEGRVFMR
jgi:hypothetical protein